MREREPGYGSDVLRVGLTGTLGAGKSTVGKALAARGAIVIDADQVARDITAQGSPGERAVLEHFGDRARAPSGPAGEPPHLDRKRLGDVVFSDASERLALEAITHPLIRSEVLRRVALARAEVVVIEIPLLDKSRKSDYGLDVVVLIDAPEKVAVQRAVSARADRNGSPRPHGRPAIRRRSASAGRPRARERREHGGPRKRRRRALGLAGGEGAPVLRLR